MTAESELVAFLRTAVGHHRVMPKLVEPETALPAIAYQRISSRPLRFYGDVAANERIRWQLWVVAADYLSVRAVVDTIKQAIEGSPQIGRIRRMEWENDSDGGQGFANENEPARLDIMMYYCKQ